MRCDTPNENNSDSILQFSGRSVEMLKIHITLMKKNWLLVSYQCLPCFPGLVAY